MRARPAGSRWAACTWVAARHRSWTRSGRATARRAGRAFGIGPDAEITLEVNPGRGEQGDLAGFRAAGVNRLSIGAQILRPRRAAPPGPAPLSRRTSRATVGPARRAGFDNLTLDLLVRRARPDARSWRQTLAAALALEPEHISAYALTLDDPGKAQWARRPPPGRPGARDGGRARRAERRPGAPRCTSWLTMCSARPA